MKRELLIVAVLAMVLPLCGALETPRGIDGTVYALDGITPVPDSVVVTISNNDTGEIVVTNVGRGAPGRYSVSLTWSKGTPITVVASAGEYNSSRSVSLDGVIHGFDLFVNVTFPPEPPEAPPETPPQGGGRRGGGGGGSPDSEPEVPLDRLTYNYYYVSDPDGEVRFTVPRTWVEETDGALGVYALDVAQWERLATTVEDGDPDYEVSARADKEGLYAVAVDALPEAGDFTVLSMPDPSTIVGVIDGNVRPGTEVVVTDLSTGDEVVVETGEGELSNTFIVTLADAEGTTVRARVGRWVSEFLLGDGVTAVQLGDGNLITGFAAFGQGAGSLAVLLVLAVLGAGSYVWWRVKSV